MSKYIFYPGCSLQKSARPYYDSLLAIKDKIDVELLEVEDWNCCGATEYMQQHRLPAYALVGRNLAIAQGQINGTNTLMAACSACYLNLQKTDSIMDKYPEVGMQINDALSAGGLNYDPGTLDVRHLLDVILNDVGIDKIKSLVNKPLKGLKIAAYYGCMVVRPDIDERFDNPEYPTELEELMVALGAEVVDFPLSTHCCSGHMTQISSDTAYELIRRLVDGATKTGADMVVTLCPMCQLNLDAYQVEMNRHFKTNYKMPVLYFTQLMGLAFGIDVKNLGVGKEFVDVAPALAKIGVEVPTEEQPKKRGKKKDKGLPMPQMSNNGGPQ